MQQVLSCPKQVLRLLVLKQKLNRLLKKFKNKFQINKPGAERSRRTGRKTAGIKLSERIKLTAYRIIFLYCGKYFNITAIKETALRFALYGQ